MVIIKKLLSTVSEQLLWNIININVGAVTMMTRMLVNDMKARGKGAIINISSGSELQPLPYMAVYAASKVSSYIFNISFGSLYLSFYWILFQGVFFSH